MPNQLYQVTYSSGEVAVYSKLLEAFNASHLFVQNGDYSKSVKGKRLGEVYQLTLGDRTAKIEMITTPGEAT